MTFYAKTDQTYEEHIEAVYVAWKQTISAKKHLLERAAYLYNFSLERFLKGSLLTIAIHDIGKMNRSFQEMIRAARENKPFNKRLSFRHELLSLIYAIEYWKEINRNDRLLSFPLEAIVIAAHHKTLDTDLSSFNKELYMEMPKIIDEGINEGINIAESIFIREGFIFPKIKIKNDHKPVGLLKNIVDRLYFTERDGPEKCRTIYFLMRGILHYADWHASGRKTVVYSVIKDKSEIVLGIKSRCEEKGIKFTGLKNFQEECSNICGNTVMVAPTGSGKTEAAIFWALNNSKTMGKTKILYLLPTMVTANNIWKRLTEFFGEDNVGLSHSTANLFLQTNSSFEDEEDKWENRQDILFNQSFIKPITVATVDQLLTAGFNAGRWALKEINAANSVIIFDEIHAYDTWTLGLIVSMIKHLAPLGARFMIMSATLPKTLEELLIKCLSGIGKAKLQKSNEYSRAKKCKYYCMDDLIDSDIAVSQIKDAAEREKRVLVVVNTVKACQDLAQKLKTFNPTCYHSQFILKDRTQIEKQINLFNEGKTPHLLIATQVIEVSLDINYDWLFTECAPPDALVQRAGRINRYSETNHDSKIFIYHPNEISKKIYDSVNDDRLLERTFDIFKGVLGSEPKELTNDELQQIVEEVYKGYEIEDNIVFKQAIEQYQRSWQRRLYLLDSRLTEDKVEVTRRSKYETISAIPLCFLQEVVNLKPAQRQWYQVKIPLWYFLKNKKERDGLLFCDLKYDQKLGAIYEKHEGLSTMIF